MFVGFLRYLNKVILYFKLHFYWLSICTCYEKTIRGSQFSPSIIWVPEIKLTLSGLEAGSFTSWVISPLLNLILEIRIFCHIQFLPKVLLLIHSQVRRTRTPMVNYNAQEKVSGCNGFNPTSQCTCVSPQNNSFWLVRWCGTESQYSQQGSRSNNLIRPQVIFWVARKRKPYRSLGPMEAYPVLTC